MDKNSFRRCDKQNSAGFSSTQDERMKGAAGDEQMSGSAL
jgi:hypothetical protein